MGKFIIDDPINGKREFDAYFPTSKIEFFNHFVDSGKQLCLDFLFNSNSWLTGATFYGPRFMSAGISSNTNAGVSGPSGTTTKPAGGDWNGPDDADWRLTSEVVTTRPQCSVVRAGKTIHIRATFIDTDFPDGANTDYNLIEFGIFCSGTVGKPSANPCTNTNADNRNNTMLVRGVSYYQQGTGYLPQYIKKTHGVPLPVQYVFSDFEG